MKLFVNDIPVEIVRMDKEIDKDDFDLIIDAASTPEIIPANLSGDVLIRNANEAHIELIFSMPKMKKLKTLDTIVFAVNDQESAVHFVKEKFKVIKAAGGIVSKGDKVLLIYRLGKWDLPKGKLDKKESAEEGAKREVEEECSVKVSLDKKIGATWHTYTQNGKRILKKTTWYRMTCLDDSKMKPQLEEDIEEIRWMNRKEVRSALQNSYRSIRDVFHKYYNMEE